jgi:acyl carrier protein
MNIKLVQVVADTFGLDPCSVTPDSGPTNMLEWDSVKHRDLCRSLEETFGVKFSSEEVKEMMSVRAIEAVLARRGAD